MRSLCCPAPAARRATSTEEPLTRLTDAIRRCSARGPVDLDAFLALAEEVESVVDRWLWDERWPVPVRSLAVPTRRLLDLGADVRTWFALTYHCRSRRDVLAVSRVVAADPEVGRRVARRLGIDPAARWYLVHTGGADVTGHGEYLVTGCWLLPAEAEPVARGRITAPGSAPVALLGPLTLAELGPGAERVAEIARLAGVADLGGVVTALDVAVERRIVRTPQALAELSAILDVLSRPGSVLPGTLRCLYANDLNKTRTAAELGIHRSSLEYRLRRVRDLTGLDPLGTRGIRTLAAALDAARLRGCAPRDKEVSGPASANGGIPGRARTASVGRRRAPGTPGAP